VVKPPNVQYLDYEVEMGIVIGKEISKGTVVTLQNIHNYVAGILLVQDFSARDIQLPQEQWTKGKSFRTFGPFGPYLFLINNETSKYLHNIQIQLYVNGEKRQDENSGDLLYKPPETLTEISHVMDFHPGDVIMTGTPEGSVVGYKKPPPKIIQRLGQLILGDQFWKFAMKTTFKDRPWLKHGDIITASGFSTDGVVQLGIMQNKIIQADPKEWPNQSHFVPFAEVPYKSSAILQGVTLVTVMLGFGVILGILLQRCVIGRHRVIVVSGRKKDS